MEPTAGHPVGVAARLDLQFSRRWWGAQWLLAIPHYMVLVVLWLTSGIVTLLAFFVILLTARYPHPLFEFNLGVLRWTWRVAYYTCGAAGADRYPPFSLAEFPGYPAHRPGPVSPAAAIGVAPGVIGAGAEGALRRDVPPAGQVGDPLPLWTLVLLGVLATSVLGGAVWAAAYLQPANALRTGALFVHLAALVVGFGAVLVVDWVALLWLLGRRSLEELTSLATAAHLPIWLGLTGLVLSGALCRPDLSTPLTWIKLGLVLLVTLNGLHAYALSDRLRRHRDGTVPPRLLLRAAAAAGISQLGWWGAMLIGFLNAQ